MNVRLGSLIVVALVVGACSKSEENAAGDSANFTEGDKPKEESIKVGNLTLTKKHFEGKVKAKNPPDEFNPSFDSCETTVDYYQISGTQHDAEINKVLRGDWEEPTSASCEDANTFGSTSTLQGIDPDQGLISISVGLDEFGGGAHPNFAQDYRILDLKSGKRLSLADYVTPDSQDKLKEIVKAKISAQKTKVDLDANNPAMAGKKHRFKFEVLDQENQDMLKGFVDSYFTSFDDNFKAIPAKLDQVRDFSIAGTGIRIDLTNTLPHALLGMDATYKLLWRDLEGAGVLRTDTDLVARTKAARPKQPH